MLDQKLIEFLRSNHAKKMLVLALLHGKSKILINRKEYEINHLIQLEKELANGLS